jgi:hypothetical protein
MSSTTSDMWLRRWQVLLSSSGARLGTPTLGAGGQVLIPATQGPPASPNKSLVVSQDTPGYDLRIRFEVYQASSETPNRAIITIYNLADSTAQGVIDEYDHVTLLCGYQTGKFGIIFDGQIKMVERGHENATDSFTRIFAADGDQALIQATINKAMLAGTTGPQIFDALADTFAEHGVSRGYVDPNAMIIPPQIRESMLFGMSADLMRSFAQANGATWSINMARSPSSKVAAMTPVTSSCSRGERALSAGLWRRLAGSRSPASLILQSGCGSVSSSITGLSISSMSRAAGRRLV